MQLEFYANANPQILEKLLDYKLDSTHNKFLASYEKERWNLDFKTIFIENYEVMLGCVKAGMGKVYVSKMIVDK